MRNCDHVPCKADATVEVNGKEYCLQHAKDVLKPRPKPVAVKEAKEEAPKRVFRKKDD